MPQFTPMARRAFCACAVLAAFACSATQLRAQRLSIDLSGPGWNLLRDESARWQGEKLYPPGTQLASIDSHAPTGGWAALAAGSATAASVPGTVEQFLYRRSAAKTEDKAFEGMTGVTWWYRSVDIPAGLEGKRVLLRFESARFRAEVYLDGKLVGYNLVEGTPFDADISAQAGRPGKAMLAVRITSPGGMWSWEDFLVQNWGEYTVPRSRGFSGITGTVKLVAFDPCHIDDLYVQNSPEPRRVNVEVTLRNDGPVPVKRRLKLELGEPEGGASPLAAADLGEIEVAPGQQVVSRPFTVASAKLWDLEHPNLYRCMAVLADGERVADSLDQSFGFRWFSAEGIGSNALFRLNGKRVVLRTAISWGFWPTSGIVPSPELAARQIDTAKRLGLNMLNFHRAIGQPEVLDLADRKGLLYFEEPGCYVTGTADPFCEALVREKVMRMVRRDRSHPSLIIYNLINEQWNKYRADKEPRLFALFESDIAQAHRIDPSRIIVLASSWARKGAGEEEPVKLNMMPFDDRRHFSGWSDYHRAGGPECWKQAFYTNPGKHYGFTANRGEIVYWGEEGAITSPPRLALIEKELAALPQPGWDGEVYREWLDRFNAYLDQKGLRGSFPTVDSFCLALGTVAFEHQGRKIEDTRICDANDGYAVNGWEAEPYENHSGVVDCFRNPKGDPDLISYYNQPLYVAVKPRTPIVPAGAPALVDFFLVNESDLRGDFRLELSAFSPGGAQTWRRSVAARAAGGDVFGELLAEGISIPTAAQGGFWTVRAALVDGDGKVRASGRDQVLVVDWKGSKPKGRGAVYENGSAVRDFLAARLGLDVPAYRDGMERLDWILVARTPRDEAAVVPSESLRLPEGAGAGVKVTFFAGREFKQAIASRTDRRLEFLASEGTSVDPAVPAGTDFCVRFEGTLVAPVSGELEIAPLNETGGTSRLSLGGKAASGGRIMLKAGEPLPFVLDFTPKGRNCSVALGWMTRGGDTQDPAGLVERARRDGTTVVLADHADSWMEWVAAKGSPVSCAGMFPVGKNWVGGQYFVRRHALFKGLPCDCALNWPYQAVIDYGRSRYGLRLQGEELVAGCWQSTPMELGTAVGVIREGAGRIVVSTLDICPHLDDPEGPADVARKLFCNYLEFAGSP